MDGDELVTLGPYCSAAGITVSDIDNPVAGKLSQITNGLILDIFDFIPDKKCESVAEVLRQLSSSESSIHDSNIGSLKKKIERANTTRRKLKRNKKSADLKKLLDAEFVPPVPTPFVSVRPPQPAPLPPSPPPGPSKRSHEEIEDENTQLKEELRQLENELTLRDEDCESLKVNLQAVVSRYRGAIAEHINDKDELKKQNKKLTREFEVASAALDKANEARAKLRTTLTTKTASVKNLEKMVQRKCAKIDQKSSKLEEAKLTLKETKKNAKTELKMKDQEMRDELTQKDDLLKEKDNLLKHANEMRKAAEDEKRKSLKNLSQTRIRGKKGKCRLVEQNKLKLVDLQKQVDTCNIRIRELEQLNSLLEDDMIKTFENGRYVDEMRETIMILLTECNVSMSKVGKVIHTVCKNLTGKIPERLPSNGTLDRILSEAKFVAQSHIVDCMINDNDPTSLLGNCLHSDATSKFHHHYQGFQITLGDGKQMSIGLQEVGSGDSEALMAAFKSTIEELASAVSSTEADEEKNIAKLVASLKNTMSDQGSINPIFNTQLHAYRSEVLPKAVAHWEMLSQPSRDSITEMGHFFCKMHVLVNWATEAEKTLKLNEADAVSGGKNPYTFSSEGGAIRLIRTAAKALTERGSDKSGEKHWLDYLEEKGKKNYIVSFRGNRFNIVYYDAAAVYHHREDIQLFLSNLPDPNNLLKSVAYDVSQKLYLAQVRALGILDKIVTGPYWRLVEGTKSILELNESIDHMLQQLKKWSLNASPLLAGETMFDEEKVPIHRDELYDSLFMSSEDVELDVFTQIALELVINSMILILERQVKDQLPGGKYYNPSQQLLQSSSNVPTTNTVAERDFAVLDVLIRLKPAASFLSYETYIMWINNKPSEWLETLTSADKEDLLTQARENYPNIKQKKHERQAQLKQQRLAAYNEKVKKKEKAEDKARLDRIAATEAITQFNGVWTLENIDEKLEELDQDQRKPAILCQLKWLKKGIHAKGAADLFYRTRGGVELGEDVLLQNLKKVLRLNAVSNENITSSNLHYHPTEEFKERAENTKVSILQKVIQQRNKIQADQQKNLLPKLCKDVSLLVGKKIKHKCREPNGDVEWFFATVISVVSHSRNNPLKTKYHVEYDVGEEWDFPLLQDIKNGDLIVVDS